MYKIVFDWISTPTKVTPAGNTTSPSHSSHPQGSSSPPQNRGSYSRSSRKHLLYKSINYIQMTLHEFSEIIVSGGNVGHGPTHLVCPLSGR